MNGSQYSHTGHFYFFKERISVGISIKQTKRTLCFFAIGEETSDICQQKVVAARLGEGVEKTSCKLCGN